MLLVRKKENEEKDPDRVKAKEIMGRAGTQGKDWEVERHASGHKKRRVARGALPAAGSPIVETDYSVREFL